MWLGLSVHCVPAWLRFHQYSIPNYIYYSTMAIAIGSAWAFGLKMKIEIAEKCNEET